MIAADHSDRQQNPQAVSFGKSARTPCLFQKAGSAGSFVPVWFLSGICNPNMDFFGEERENPLLFRKAGSAGGLVPMWFLRGICNPNMDFFGEERENALSFSKGGQCRQLGAGVDFKRNM